MNKAKHFETAEKFIKKDSLDRAIKELRKILKVEPAEEQARLLVGDLLARKGEINEACEEYLIVAEACAADERSTLKAVAVFKQILKLDPSAAQIMIKLGDLYRTLKLASEAMKQYQAAAQHYKTKGLAAERLSVLRKIVELDPDDGRMLTALDQIANLDPSDEDLVRRVARMHLDGDNPKRALKHLSKLFKADPADVDTLELLAETFQALDQKDKAITIRSEIQKLKGTGTAKFDAGKTVIGGGPPKQPPVPAPVEPAERSDSTFDLAAELAKSAEAEQADTDEERSESTLKEVLEQAESAVSTRIIQTASKESKKAQLDLGRTYKNMGLLDEAIIEFQNAMTDHELAFECLAMIAIVQHLKGDKEKAVANLERAAELLTT